jgi:hypothetical protein
MGKIFWIIRPDIPSFTIPTYYHLFDLYLNTTFLIYKPSTQSFVLIIKNDAIYWRIYD